MMIHKRSFIYILLAAIFTLTNAHNSSAYADADFWIQTPDNWNETTHGLSSDLKKQVISPDRNAMIEVYAAKGNNPGLQVIADGMEEHGLNNGAAYFRNRISSKNIMQDNHPAIFREYSSNHEGNRLHAYAIFAYGNGGAVMAVGVFAEALSHQYQNIVYECIKSLRFSPPPTAGSSNPYAGSQGNPYGNQGGGCERLVGKWKWFTGSQAEFYADGRMPGNGNSWQCVDPARGVVKVIWSNGKWVDTLTISADGSRVDGQNQVGNRVWGTRISGGSHPAPTQQVVPAQQPRPKMNYAKKVRGNMGAEWRLAHGSLKAGTSDHRAEWELSTVSGTTLRFTDPYKKGQQRYRVKILTKDNQVVEERVVGMSEHITVSPGIYKIRMFAEGGYAGWRCEWH
ncbi:hypothetical protein [Desulfovibrio sp. JC010]|uniref:hypothetical protein n=1 Tax=Desulfovibrio sp. JC010 TaxID=2593641 RepID=UPI0013D63833|nr:hypothetical protein [Desulfovibrio sp. JC010]NDV27834.1 hypothetical protein [Desulfovibrio sp. JC010]